MLIKLFKDNGNFIEKSYFEQKYHQHEKIL